jgi:MFS family permease
MKTAIWLYLFMFVAFFDLHAQYPILSPFALSIGATPSFIGLILGMYSITHLPGNLLAGYGVDRFGSKKFIVASLIGAGIVLILQSRVTNPWQLLAIRSVSGFVLAFLSPACLAMLAKLARDRVHQSKLMAGNGLVHTLASVVSPAAGAFLVAKLGFTASFTALGWGLIFTGIFSIFGIKETKTTPQPINPKTTPQSGDQSSKLLPSAMRGAQARQAAADSEGPAVPWLFFGVPLAISCSQGILFFELPLLKSSLHSILNSGLLFSLISFGALFTLSLLFLNRIHAFQRTMFSCLGLALIFFGMAVQWPVPLYASLFLIGMAKGVLFPAIATLLAGVTSSKRYGRVFSLLSIAYSIGAFFGPVLAGHYREHFSPYFLAFLALMLGLALLPVGKMHAIPAK